MQGGKGKEETKVKEIRLIRGCCLARFDRLEVF